MVQNCISNKLNMYQYKVHKLFNVLYAYDVYVQWYDGMLINGDLPNHLRLTVGCAQTDRFRGQKPTF